MMTSSDTNSETVERESKALTRRQLLSAAAAGGAGIAVSAIGGAAVGSLATRAEYELELTKLRALVALYEQLERVGLDAILAAGMKVVQGALDVVKAGVHLLRDGVVTAENALKAFQTTIDSMRGAADNAGQALNDLAAKFHAAESIIDAVLGTALPLTESIRGFLNALLDKIPFGVGDDIRRAVGALTDLIRAIPATVDALTTQLLKPLRALFFPTSGDAAMKSNLLDPLTQLVLEPLKRLLSDIEDLLDRWERDFTQPVQSALDDRAKIRQQIAEFKKQNGMA